MSVGGFDCFSLTGRGGGGDLAVKAMMGLALALSVTHVFAFST